jgi:hypothetical protein
MRASFLVSILLLAASTASADVENKWRLEFSGNAESEGHLILAIAPKNQPAVNVTVDIPRHISENDVARAVRDALLLQVGDTYKIERDDGEDVLIKRREGEPRFSVAMVENTVKGVRLHIEEE